MSEPVWAVESPACTISVYEGVGGLDPVNDNVDVEVRLEDGSRWAATFFTLENLRETFEKNSRTAECRGGLYFWASGMVIVRHLTHESIVLTVEELMEEDELSRAFEHLEDGE